MLVLAMLTCALIVRVYGVRTGILDFDSLHSAAFVQTDDLWAVLTSVRLYDPHPPLYYLQLHVWFRFFGTNDVAAVLNAAFWSFLATLSLYRVTRIIFTPRIALMALAFLTLAPYAVFYAQSARMYGMLMLIGIWAWYFTHQYLQRAASRLLGSGLALSCAAALFLHGTGFLIVGSVCAYVALWLLEDIRNRRVQGIRCLGWLLLGILPYLLWLLWAGAGFSVSHTVAPTLRDVNISAYDLLFFRNPLRIQLLPPVMLALSVWLLQKPTERRIVLAFLWLPLIAGYILSHTIRPIWLTRTFSYLTPFLCLFVALVLDRLVAVLSASRWRLPPQAQNWLAALMTIAAVCYFALSLPNLLPPESSDAYETAKYLAEHTQPDDHIYLSHPSIFITLSWYYHRPLLSGLESVAMDQRFKAANTTIYIAPYHPPDPQASWYIDTPQLPMPDTYVTDDSSEVADVATAQNYGNFRIWRVNRVESLAE